MDEFDKLVASVVPTRQSILERVDEYSLYLFYTERDDLIPGRLVNSPLRPGDDRTPSFGIFPAWEGKGYDEFEFTWLDSGNGETGNIFSLVKRLYPDLKSYSDVYALISKDFELGIGNREVKAEKIVLKECPPPVNMKIRVHSIPFTSQAIAYWNQFRISKEILERYNVTQIDYYWSYAEQTAPKLCTTMTFAYRLGAYYQLYSPYAEKKDKFRNDLPGNYFLGYLQLPSTGDILIYDKALKDVMFDRVLDYWAVCGKSETIMIPHAKMLELRPRFKRHFLTLDPDEAGRAQTQKYLDLYPWLEPRFLKEAKDKTDLALKVGVDQAKEIIQKLLT